MITIIFQWQTNVVRLILKLSGCVYALQPNYHRMAAPFYSGKSFPSDETWLPEWSGKLGGVQRCAVWSRGREVRPRRAYDDSEFAALLSVAGKQRIVYLTAPLTGIRHGELKKLRWGDINLIGEKPSVTVRASVSKNHRQACLPLHSALVPATATTRTRRS